METAGVFPDHDTSRLCLLRAWPGLARAGVLDPQGPVSAAERLILLNATGIMLVVVLPVIVLTLAFAWWYRASNKRAAYRPEWSYSGHIELVVWAIPSMVVILLAGVAWTGSHELDPARPLDADAYSQLARADSNAKTQTYRSAPGEIDVRQTQLERHSL